MATLSLDDLDALPAAPPRGGILSLDDLANLDPKTNSTGPMSWGDAASSAVKNIPSSAYNLAAGIANTVMHPIDTAQGLYDVGKGAVSKAAGAVGIPQDPDAKAQSEQSLDAVMGFFADRYGGVEQFKKTLADDPVGLAMDLSTILTGGQAALSRVPGIVGRAGELAGDAARVTNPANAATAAVKGVRVPGTALNVGVEPAVSTVLGMTTGAGAAPIRTAARAGYEGNKVFRNNMTGGAPMTDVIDQAQNAVSQMGRDRGAAYRAGMAGVNADKTKLSMRPLAPTLKDAKDMVYFNGIAKSEDAANVLKSIQDKIGEWSNAPPQIRIDPKTQKPVQYYPHKTAEGFDALKQALGEIRQSTQPGTLSRKVADSVYHATKATIVKQAPEYAKTMGDYADATDKIKELTKTFSLGEKASQDTALRKLQSTTRNNVNTNYGARTRLLDELTPYAPDLIPALAGQSLSSITPRGLAAQMGAIGIGGNGIAMHGLPALMNPSTLAALPFFSPRFVGEGAYAAGRVGNALSIAPAADMLPGAAKVGNILNVIASQSNGLQGGSGPRYDENGNLRSGQ